MKKFTGHYSQFVVVNGLCFMKIVYIYEKIQHGFHNLVTALLLRSKLNWRDLINYTLF